MADNSTNPEPQPFRWRTAIAWKNKDRIVVRGYDVNDLTGVLNFGEMLHLVLRGEIPGKAQGAMVNAMMVSIAEHAFSPSGATVRFSTAGGAELPAAVASGVAALGRLHGSADGAAELFERVDDHIRDAAEHDSLAQGALEVVREMRENRQTMPGFHHPQHIQDPRSARLFEVADELGVSGRFVDIARAMEKATEPVFGRRLWINAPGAIGCIGLDLGFRPIQLKALILTARTLSLCAHSIEESERERPWRASSANGLEMVQPLALSMQGPEFYDGPADRAVT